MQMTPLEQRVEELKQKLASKGVMPTHAVVRNAMQDAEAQAERVAIASGGIKQDPRISQRVQQILGWLSVLFTGLFMVLGVLAVLFFFPISEGRAVYEGMVSFGTHPSLASITAFCLVIGISLAVFIEQITREGVGDVADRHLTLAGIKRWFNIFTGKAQPHVISNELRLYRSVSSTVVLLKGTIIVLSIFGRSATLIGGSESVWYRFLVEDLLLSAPIAEAMGVVGVLLTTAAMLQTTETIIYYVYMLFTTLAGTLSTRDAQAKKAQALLAAQESALNDILIAVEARERQRLQQQVNTQYSDTSAPTGTPTS